MKVLRALVKETLSRAQIDRLADDIEDACATLEKKGGAHKSRAPQDETQPQLLSARRLPEAAARSPRGPIPSRWPPGSLAEPVGDRRDQQRADDEGVEQDPDRDRGADLDQLLERQQGQGREGAGQDQPGPGDDAAGVTSAASVPSRVPSRAASSRARVIRKML